MTNNEIVEIVYKTFDIKQLVRRFVDYSKLDNTDDDLCQYIYLTLLNYDNKKLNYLYENKLLMSFIAKIILNQRNYYKSEYQGYRKSDGLYNDGLEIPYTDYKEEKIENENKYKFIESMLHKYTLNGLTGYTIEEKRRFFIFEIYKLYLRRGYTFTEMSKKLKINRNIISNSIQDCRAIIRDEYKKINKK